VIPWPVVLPCWTCFPFQWLKKSLAGWPTQTLKAFVQAALRGSYPELVVFPKLDTTAWYGGLCPDLSGAGCAHPFTTSGICEIFKRFIQTVGRPLRAGVESEFPGRRFQGSASPTAKNWLSILEAGRIIYLLPPYHTKSWKSGSPKRPSFISLTWAWSVI